MSARAGAGRAGRSDGLPPALEPVRGGLARDFPQALHGGSWWQPRQGVCSVVWVLEAADSHVLKLAEGAFHVGLLRREHERLVALAGTGLPVPTVRALVDGDGVAVLVTSRVDGVLARTRLRQETDPAVRRRLLRSIGATLRRVHDTPVPPGLGVGEPWIDRVLREAAANLAAGHNDGGSAADLARLRAAPPPPVAETLVHGDFTLNNCLVAGDQVSGVIDWSHGGAGDPRYDLALVGRHKPDALRHPGELAHLFAGYGAPAPPADVVAYFERLYEYF